MASNKEQLDALNTQLREAGLEPVERKAGGEFWAFKDAIAEAERRLSAVENDTSTATNKGAVLDVSFDPGNREIGLFDGTKYIRFPAFYAFLYGFQVPSAPIDEESEVVNVISSEGSPELDGKRYVIGKAAKAERNPRRVYIDPKAEKSLIYLLPLIARTTDAEDITVRVNVNITDPVRDQPTLTGKLSGVTEFEVNGKTRRINVIEVKAFREGLGAWYIARENGLIVPNSYTGIINLGGGTADGILVDETGFYNPRAKFEAERGGTYALALNIRERLAGYVSASFDLDLIMDYLAGDRTFLNPNIPINDVIPGAIADWFVQIKDEIRNYWIDYFDEVSQYIVTGGSGYLIEDRVSKAPNWSLTPNPTEDNARGLWKL